MDGGGRADSLREDMSMIRKMPVPGLDPGMEAGFPKRSCSTKINSRLRCARAACGAVPDAAPPRAARAARLRRQRLARARHSETLLPQPHFVAPLAPARRLPARARSPVPKVRLRAPADARFRGRARGVRQYDRASV